jgi:hypothetical protein
MEKIFSLLMFFVLSLSFAVFANDIGAHAEQVNNSRLKQQSIDELRQFKDYNRVALGKLSPQARYFLRENKTLQGASIDGSTRKEIQRYFHLKKQAFDQLSPYSKMLLSKHYKNKIKTRVRGVSEEVSEEYQILGRKG